MWGLVINRIAFYMFHQFGIVKNQVYPGIKSSCYFVSHMIYYIIYLCSLVLFWSDDLSRMNFLAVMILEFVFRMLYSLQFCCYSQPRSVVVVRGRQHQCPCCVRLSVYSLSWTYAPCYPLCQASTAHIHRRSLQV